MQHPAQLVPAPVLAPASAPAAERAQAMNRLAIAAFVAALWGWFIVALPLGYMSLRQIDRSGGTQDGRWLATTSIVVGWIVLALWLIIVALFAMTALVTADAY